MPSDFTGNPFGEAFNHLMQAEGGFFDDPSGGPTKYGITLRTLRQARGNDALGPEDVKNLTLDAANAIYFKHYWQPLGFEKCDNTLACMVVFDQAVNRGIATVLGEVSNLLTLNPSHPTICDLLNFYWDERESFPHLNGGFLIRFLVGSQKAYMKLALSNPNLQKFLNGWLNRTHRLFALVA